jgi:hypothetical protein
LRLDFAFVSELNVEDQQKEGKAKKRFISQAS